MTSRCDERQNLHLLIELARRQTMPHSLYGDVKLRIVGKAHVVNLHIDARDGKP